MNKHLISVCLFLSTSLQALSGPISLPHGGFAFEVERPSVINAQSLAILMRALRQSTPVDVIPETSGWQIFVGGDASNLGQEELLRLLTALVANQPKNIELAEIAEDCAMNYAKHFQGGSPQGIAATLLHQAVAVETGASLVLIQAYPDLEKFLVVNQIAKRMKAHGHKLQAAKYGIPMLHVGDLWRSWEYLKKHYPMDSQTGKLLGHHYTAAGFVSGLAPATGTPNPPNPHTTTTSPSRGHGVGPTSQNAQIQGSQRPPIITFVPEAQPQQNQGKSPLELGGTILMAGAALPTQESQPLAPTEEQLVQQLDEAVPGVESESMILPPANFAIPHVLHHPANTRAPITIVTSFDATTANWADVAIPNQKAYAQKHQYDFYAYEGNLTKWGFPNWTSYKIAHADKEPEPVRASSWSKVVAILDRLHQMPEGEWLVWVNTEVVFTDTEQKWENLIALFENVDGRQRDLIITKGTFAPLNNGVMLIRNTAWSRKFFQRVWEQKQFARDGEGQCMTSGCKYDQEAMTLLWEKLDLEQNRMIRIEQVFMNSLFGSNEAMLDLPQESLWQPGNFIAQIQAATNEERLELLQHLIDEKKDL